MESGWSLSTCLLTLVLLAAGPALGTAEQLVGTVDSAPDPFTHPESLAGYQSLLAHYADLVEGSGLSCSVPIADLALEAHGTDDLARVRMLQAWAQAETLGCLLFGAPRGAVPSEHLQRRDLGP